MEKLTQVQLQRVHEIRDQIKRIKKLQEATKSPVFIELLGTPKSGKTTLKKALMKLADYNGLDFMARQETAEVNPIEKGKVQYDPWMVLELMKNVAEDMSSDSSKIVLYDRGLLDRVPWMRYDVINGTMSKGDFDRFMALYNSNLFRSYRPISRIFITSPELSVQRKGKPGFFVNVDSVGKYNGLLDESLSEIMNHSGDSKIIKTDDYQGYLKGFIVDSVHGILEDVEINLSKQVEMECGVVK